MPTQVLDEGIFNALPAGPAAAQASASAAAPSVTAVPNLVQSLKTPGVASETATSQSTSTAFGSNVTSGNRILVYACNTGITDAVILAPSDTQGNTYTELVSNSVLHNVKYVFVSIWTAVAGSTGANTITVTTPTQASGSCYLGWSAQEWRSLSTASGTGCLDVSAAGTFNNNTTANADSGTTSPVATAGEVAVSAVGDIGYGWTWAVAGGTAGFIQDLNASTSGDLNTGVAVATMTAAAGSTSECTWSNGSNSGVDGAVVAVIKPKSGGTVNAGLAAVTATARTASVIPVSIYPSAALLTGAALNASVSGGGSAITSRPNDGSGYWPDSSNTGYLHAPGYTGSLATGNPYGITSSTTYSQMSFNGCNPGFLSAGGASPVSNVTFDGCLFWGVFPNSWLVRCAGSNFTFNYCSFMPTQGGAPRWVNNANSYQYSVLYDGSLTSGADVGKLTVANCDFWGFGDAFQIDGSTQAAPHSITGSWFHHAADTVLSPGGGDSLYHTEAILCTVGGANETYVVISGNTIDSLGITNGIALQLDGGAYYSNITAENNYISGWGYSVQIGGNGSGNSNITFTGNIWSTASEAYWGPLYGWGGTGNTWRRNLYQCFSGDPVTSSGGDTNPIGLTTAGNGQYWWPTDTSPHAADYTGG